MADLAREFGVSHPAVQKWLKNTIPSGVTVSEIARFFGVAVDDLLYGPEKRSIESQPLPSSDDVEEQFRRLPKEFQRSITTKLFREMLAECDAAIAPSDVRRGWVEVNLQYKVERVPEDYPSKVRVHTLPPPEHSFLLASAASKHDAHILVLNCLSKSEAKFLASEGSPLLTPFCWFALTRAAVRMNFGDEVAPKILRNFGLGYWLDLLEEGSAGK